MKKLLLSILALTMLLNCSLSAKEPLAKKQYKVEIITEQSNKKGLGTTVYIKIRDFVLVVIESATANKIAGEVQNYVNAYGLRVQP